MPANKIAYDASFLMPFLLITIPIGASQILKKKLKNF